MEWGWFIAGLALIVTLLAGAIRTAKSHIETNVKMTCDEKLDKIDQDLGAIRINVAEVSSAVGKVSDLERKIGNGLENRLIKVETMTAEMHGWMKAQNGRS
jgi:hypothetical protein